MEWIEAGVHVPLLIEEPNRHPVSRGVYIKKPAVENHEIYLLLKLIEKHASCHSRAFYFSHLIQYYSIMCGRFTHTVDKVEFIIERFKAELAPGFEGYQPSYNVAPGQLVPVVVAKEGRRYLLNMLWGFVPPWGGKEEGKIMQQINIRDDTIAKNKFFRDRLSGNRCIFVADGFYEWQKPTEFRDLPRGEKLPKGVRKTPYYIIGKERGFLPLAGLWRTAEIKEKPVATAAIITTSPNRVMKEIHNRMPVILGNDGVERWLDSAEKKYSHLEELLIPYSAGLTAYVVSDIVNNNRYNDPRCIEPAASPSS
ncbi:MAG: SOS response-associated peptidase [Bacteroidota bacterium]